jgi:hypothetical protein
VSTGVHVAAYHLDVASVLSECCIFLRDLNVSINIMLLGIFILFFDGRLSTFFNIFLMLQTLNFDIADVEFRYYKRCF